MLSIRSMDISIRPACLQNVKYFNFGPSATDTLCRLYLVLDGVETFTMSDALKLDYEFSNHHEKKAPLQARTKH